MRDPISNLQLGLEATHGWQRQQGDPRRQSRRDPEIRSTNDGTRIANLNLATSESWRDRNSGERKERTEWHRVVIFNENLVTIAEKYLRKGSKIYVEGAPADPQMDRQRRRRKILDRGGAAKIPRRIDDARRRRGRPARVARRRGGYDEGDAGSWQRRAPPSGAGPRPRPQRRPRRRNPF
jgi:single-strand DNA-binding protein